MIVCLERRQRAAGPWLIAPIHARQMTRISGKISHGQAVTAYEGRRRPERPDSLAAAPQGMACCEGPPCDGVMRLRCVDRERGAATSSQQRAPPPAGQTGPRHGFHQCGIKPTGSDTVSPYISTHDLYMLGTSLCLYAALLLVELMLTTASRLNSAPAERMLWPCLCWSPTEACWARCAHRPDVRRRCVCCHHHA